MHGLVNSMIIEKKRKDKKRNSIVVVNTVIRLSNQYH